MPLQFPILKKHTWDKKVVNETWNIEKVKYLYFMREM